VVFNSAPEAPALVGTGPVAANETPNNTAASTENARAPTERSEGRPQRAIKPWATARPPNGRERCKGAEDEGGQRGEVDNLDHPGCYPGGGADLSEPEQSDPQRQEVAAESCQRERGPRRRQQTAARCEEAQTKGKCRDQLK